jgi:hypothetical protein
MRRASQRSSRVVQPHHGLGFSSRYECKYLVDEWTAEAIRDAVAMVLELDPHCQREPTRSYLNTSLYLDSRDLICYRATALAARNRFKLRARWYAGDTSCGTVIEEKRRADNAITKVRARLLPGGIERLNAGEPLGESMAPEGEREGAALQYLMDLASRHTAGPSCTVRYRREAWISSTAYVRVSFDTELEGHALTPSPPAVDSPDWERVDLPGVIVEFKFEREAPQWMGDIARSLNLRRRSIPKYLLCIDHLARGRDFQHIAELPRWRTAWTA